MKEVINEHLLVVVSIRINDPNLAKETMKNHLKVIRIKGG